MLDEEMKSEFIEEGQTLHQNLLSGIKSLKENLQDEEAIENTFRSFHTLKGNAGFAGLSGIYRLYYGFTEFMRPVYDGKKDLSEDMLDKLPFLAKYVKQSLEKVEKDEDLPKEKANQLLDKLKIQVE